MSTPRPSTQSPSQEEKIRLRAYQLYEKRGGQNGSAQDDWLQAEAELLHSKIGEVPTRITSFKKTRRGNGN